ncbi:MAG: hypothetical protein HC795_07685 [Coleofasciculaceae cyanobacterium RL_1_1]|nr:hypothetical protein [Coleofasciculaceae cyanobacterium RL_1_1]
MNVIDRTIIFTRYPQPGETKTRLIPGVGARGAALLQCWMTEWTIGRAIAWQRSAKPTDGDDDIGDQERDQELEDVPIRQFYRSRKPRVRPQVKSQVRPQTQLNRRWP